MCLRPLLQRQNNFAVGLFRAALHALLQAVEHPHGRTEGLWRERWLEDPRLKKKDLWPTLQRAWIDANPLGVVQADIDDQPKTCAAVIKAGGQKLRRHSKLT